MGLDALNIGQGLSSALGAVEKAKIQVIDLSGRPLTKKQLSAKKKVTSGIGKMDKNLTKAYLNKEMRGSNEASLKERMKKAKIFTYNVMFNPSDLSITGWGGEEIPTQRYDKADEKLSKEELKKREDAENEKLRNATVVAAATRAELNVKLIFDKVDPQDAFYSDKFTLSQTSIAKGAAKAIKKGIKSGLGGYDSHSVQPDVEAFTAMLRDPMKRLVIFTWGTMSYQGMLNNISAEYTMFNVLGEPVRATVSLGIIILDGDVYAQSVDIWKSIYAENFGGMSALKAAGKYLKL